jgi:hypothetical protein
MTKRKVKISVKGVNKFAVPFVAWALMLFLVFTVPLLMRLDNSMTIGLMVWLLLVSNVTAWFATAFQRWQDEVNNG